MGPTTQFRAQPEIRLQILTGKIALYLASKMEYNYTIQSEAATK